MWDRERVHGISLQTHTALMVVGRPSNSKKIASQGLWEAISTG